MTAPRTLRLALPKGSLQDSTFRIFQKAGFKVSTGKRSYILNFDDEELEGVLLRAQEIPRFVADGALDAGLTGKDWIAESEVDVVTAAEMIYAKEGLRPVRWVVAVPNDSPIKTLRDLEGKRIATELVSFTRRVLAAEGITAQVEFSWGATEIKTPLLVDAIVELTETGNSLRANNLRIVETLLESNTHVIANHKAWSDPWKNRKIQEIVMLLRGALVAEEKVGLKMNLRRTDLDAVLSDLDALKNPTVSPLSDPDWVAVETIIDERRVRQIIPRLKEKGAQGIIEYPLNKVIP